MTDYQATVMLEATEMGPRHTTAQYNTANHALSCVSSTMQDPLSHHAVLQDSL